MSTIKAGNSATTTLLRTPDTSGNLTFTADNQLVLMNTNTGELNLPAGTTAQRPATPRVGMLRYNSSTGSNEIYIDTAWANITSTRYPYTASYLVVAGAGGGGAAYSGGGGGGGGGAGGLLSNTSTITPGTVYTLTIGAGGAGATYTGALNRRGTIGANSSISSLSITSVGGGYGGGVDDNGGNGGSGGGGGTFGGGSQAGGSGTVGQGNNGGSSNNLTTGGGGGGAGSAGSLGTAGSGLASSISGSSVTYSAGGGVGSTTSGGVNTGNGGSGNTGTGNAGSGGSGIIILSVPTTSFSNTYSSSNVAVTTSGSNTIILFYASGTYTG
jgi:hypothetical protein